MYSYERISLAHRYKYHPGLANLCIQYGRKRLFTMFFVQFPYPVMPWSIVFGGTCRITEWRIVGAFHRLEHPVGQERGKERRGEGSVKGARLIISEIILFREN